MLSDNSACNPMVLPSTQLQKVSVKSCDSAGSKAL